MMGRGNARGRGRKRKGPGRVVTVPNNKSSIPDVSDEKQEILPTIGRDGNHILVQIPRTKQINKILKSTVSNKPRTNLNNPQDHPLTETIPEVRYNFRPRASGRLPDKPPRTPPKNIDLFTQNTDSAGSDAMKGTGVKRIFKKAPSVGSSASNKSHLSEMIPFSFVNVPDKRYENYIPMNMMVLQNSCEGSIDSSDDGNSSYSSGEQRAQTGEELAKSPLREAIGSAASSPLGSALDEYEFTTEEEDRLLHSSEDEDASDTGINSEMFEPKAKHQTTNLSSFTEPSVKEVFKSKDIILRSDNNITIRAFSSDIFKNNINKAIKPKYCTSSQPKVQQRHIPKKFKWDYHPDVPVKLFSQDTGYESESSGDNIKDCDERISSTNTPSHQSDSCFRINSNSSAASSIISSEWTNSKPLTNFKVTCTDQHRVFESVSIAQENNAFKVPSLPPVKRPPSRPRKSDTSSGARSNSSSTGSSNCNTRVDDRQHIKHGGSEYGSGTSNITRLNPSSMWSVSQKRMVTDSKDKRLTVSVSVPAKPSNHIPDDDSIISITASTLDGDHDVANLNDLRGMGDSEVKTEPEVDFKEESFLGEKRPFIENWVEDVNSAVPTEWNDPAPSNWSGVENMNFRSEQRQPDIQQKDNVVLPNNNINNDAARVDFKDVPHLLNGVCYFKYINGACKKKCGRDHELKRDIYMRKFEKAVPKQVVDAYQFLKKLAQCNNHTFYKDIHGIFLLAFGHHKLQNELISCIQDLFLLQHCIDVSEGIEFVVKGLELSGLTFLEAVEKISYNVGFMQYPLLADYLLQLMSRKSQLKSNWDVMKRLIKARGHISPELASSILLKATNMYPLDKTLCKDVYRVIVEQKMTEVSKLEPKYLTPIRMLVTTSMSKGSTVPSGEASNNQIITSPETLKQHINTNLHWQREIFEKSRSPEVTISDKPSIFNSTPIAPAPLFNSPVKVNRHSLSSCSPSSCSNNSMDSSKPCYFEPSNSSRSHYVPKAMPRQAISDVVTLTPIFPIVGKANYRPDYKMNVSLHNLLPDSDYHADMNESDVTKLNEAIRYTDADVFLGLLEQHRSRQSVKKFITMAVANLRNCSGVYKTFMDLVNAIVEISPDFVTSSYKKGMMEVIVFNLLHTIEKKGCLKHAANMLAKFCDWDSLVSSQIFPYKMTHMGRYIYLAKILVNGENFQYAYEILQCPTLYLLESPDMWPYPHHPEHDLKFRNEVLADFFQKGYQHNFLVVIDMYRRTFTHSGIYGFDADTTFHDMMINLINKNKITDLKHLIEDIQSFANHMDVHVLRAYTAVVSAHLPVSVSKMLYDLCCERRIYPKFQGTERVIHLYNNTLDEEIYLILLAYFRVVLSNRFPPTDVTIKIAIPDAYPPHPDVIKLVRCVKDINIVVKNILKDKFNIFVKEEHPQCSAWLVVTLDQIKTCKLSLR